MSDDRKQGERRNIGEAEIAQVISLVEGGATIKSAAQRAGIRYNTLMTRAVRDPGLRARLDEAVAERGFSPKRPSGARDMTEFRAALVAGASLADACGRAGISIEALRLRRLKDPELDSFVAKLLHRRSFDAAAKTVIVAGIRQGAQIRDLLEIAGGFDDSTFRAHLKRDGIFRARVREALGGFDDPLERITPTRAKVYFSSILELLPSCNTLTEALDIYGVKVGHFYHLLRYSPPRKAAFEALVAALPKEGRGKRAPRPFRQGCVLDASAIRVAVLEAVSSGVPLYMLASRGLPSGTTCFVYSTQNPDFRARLAKALLEGHQKRVGDPRGRIAAAIEAVGNGVKPANLSRLGFVSAQSVYAAKRSDPQLDEMYQDARRKVVGLPSAKEHLGVDELVAIVRKRLPAGLTKDELADCLSDAWIDASEGSLNAANLPSKVRQYVAANRTTEHYARVEVGRNGDLVFAERS